METTELEETVDQGLRVTDQAEIRTSRDGYRFNLNADAWQLNKDIKLSVSWTAMLLPEVNRSYREVSAYYSENYSADYACTLNDRLHGYFRYTGKPEISVSSLISYRSSLDKQDEWYLSNIRILLNKWHKLGYPGVDQDVIDLLSGWRLKGNEKGSAILSFDPVKGPLTDMEMDTLTGVMLEEFVSGKIKLADYALVSVLTHTGRRAVQIVSLKLKDLLRETSKGTNRYFINFPRAKQRDIGFREEFSKYPIIEDLWLLLNQHTQEVIARISEIVGGPLSDSLVSELPLFPNYRSFAEASQTGLTESLKRDVHHAPRTVCNDALKRCAVVKKMTSERTGEQIHMTSRRFRQTLGTNLAREGKGVYVIAEALDHSDTQHAGTYVKNLPDIVERIDKAVAMQLAPLAQAFQGLVVKSEQDAVRGNDPSSRISNGQDNVGSCGSYGFCGALAPIACYTCTHFQPWLDGPHKDVLDELIAQRDQVLAETGDPKIASVNDRLILAVSDVIHRCIEMKASQEGVNHG